MRRKKWEELKCPICEGRKFYERKYDNKIRMIDFTDRTITNQKKIHRRKSYVCLKCGFSLYGDHATRIRKEMKYLEIIDGGNN